MMKRLLTTKPLSVMNDQIFKNTHLTIVIKYMKICKNSFGNFENGRSSMLRTGVYLVFSSTYLP